MKITVFGRTRFVRESIGLPAQVKFTLKLRRKTLSQALQHAADFNSNMLYIVAGSIKNLDKYVNGEITDFTQVGIKATDDYTLEYTLNGPESYWNSKTAYSILYPINKEFLETKGAGCKLGSPGSINLHIRQTATRFNSVQRTVHLDQLHLEVSYRVHS